METYKGTKMASKYRDNPIPQIPQLQIAILVQYGST